jgi:hypothetical protein
VIAQIQICTAVRGAVDADAEISGSFGPHAAILAPPVKTRKTIRQHRPSCLRARLSSGDLQSIAQLLRNPTHFVASAVFASSAANFLHFLRAECNRSSRRMIADCIGITFVLGRGN